MSTNHQYLFRVVGGFSQRKTLIKYEIIPYIITKETNRYYFVTRNGTPSMQHKRTTSNSELFLDVYEALARLLERIHEARVKVAESMEKVCSGDQFESGRWGNRIYIVTFNKEIFKGYCYMVNKETRQGMFIGEKTYNGKRYIYPHVSKPHNPESPFEQFMSKDLGTLLSEVRLYGESRLAYFHWVSQHNIDWVRIWSREHNNDAEIKNGVLD